jgi:hypothetical protein
MDPPKIQQEFLDPPKMQATPPGIYIIFADPPKRQWTYQKYNTKKNTKNKLAPFRKFKDLSSPLT